MAPKQAPKASAKKAPKRKASPKKKVKSAEEKVETKIDEEDVIEIADEKCQVEEDVIEIEEEDVIEVAESKVEVEEDKIEVTEDKIEVEEDKIEVEEDKIEVEEDKIEIEEVLTVEETEAIDADVEMTSEILMEPTPESSIVSSDIPDDIIDSTEDVIIVAEAVEEPELAEKEQSAEEAEVKEVEEVAAEKNAALPAVELLRKATEEALEEDATDDVSMDAESPVKEVTKALKKGMVAAPKAKAIPKSRIEHEEDDTVEHPSECADVRFQESDATINTVIGRNGVLVNSLQGDALQYLAAGARANHAVPSGCRVYYEIKVIEHQNAFDVARKTTCLKNAVRFGFGTADSDHLIGSDNTFGFDGEGAIFGMEKKRTGRRFDKTDVMGVLLNRIEGHENFNTVSLFRNGQRLTEPYALPESMADSPLCPIVNVKSVSVLVNFKAPWNALPMKVSPFAFAQSLTPLKPAEDEALQCIIPMALPNTGGMDALDMWLKQHPGMMEVSNRVVARWAELSGHKLGKANKDRHSLNTPDSMFGIAELDNPDALKKQLVTLARFFGRSFVYSDFKTCMCHDKRAEIFKLTNGMQKTGIVFMGEPSEEFKEEQIRLQKKHLAEKQKKSDDDITLPAKFLLRTLEVPELREREVSNLFSKFKLPVVGEFDDVVYAWGDEEECAQQYATEILARKMTEKVTGLQPSAWFKEKLDAWLNTKLDWRRKHKEFLEKKKKSVELAAKQKRQAAELKEQKMKAWKRKSQELKLKFKRQMTEFEKKKAAFEKRQAEAEEKGEDFEEEFEEEEPVEETQEEEPPVSEDEEGASPGTENDDEVDVWTCDDVNDNGNGSPIYASWALEDWTLINVRYEFHLLIHAFLHDVNDDQRKGIYKPHLEHYYDLYYKRHFHAPQYGCKTLDGLIEMLVDTVQMDKNTVEAEHPIETPFSIFVKLTEEARRERMARIEAGDESARLSFAQPTASAIRPNAPAQKRKSAPSGPAPTRPAQARTSTQARTSLPQKPSYKPSAPAPRSTNLRDNLMRSATNQGRGYGSAGTYGSAVNRPVYPKVSYTGGARTAGYGPVYSGSKRPYDAGTYSDAKRRMLPGSFRR